MLSIMKYQITPFASIIQLKPHAFFKMHLKYNMWAGSLPFGSKIKKMFTMAQGRNQGIDKRRYFVKFKTAGFFYSGHFQTFIQHCTLDMKIIRNILCNSL